MDKGTGSAGQTAHAASEREKGESEPNRLPDAEFVGSTSFRSASLVQPLWRDLGADGHYFGGNESNIFRAA
jgi:hypothetical protein